MMRTIQYPRLVATLPIGAEVAVEEVVEMEEEGERGGDVKVEEEMEEKEVLGEAEMKQVRVNVKRIKNKKIDPSSILKG